MNVPGVRPLAILADLVRIDSGFAFKSDRFASEGELPVVRIRDVVRGYSETYYSGDYDEQYLVSDGDLLVGMDGEFNRQRWRGGMALLNQRVCRIAADESRLSNNYLYHFLPKALKEIEDQTPFATVKHLSTKDIKNIEIPLPPLDEQQRIAAILDKADALRRRRKRVIELLDGLSQSIFLEMFGTEARVRRQPLGELAELINGDRSSNYPSGDDLVSSGILFLNTTNITPEGLDLSKANYITNEKFASLTRGKLVSGDIVITLRGSLGQTAMFDRRDESGFINAQMMIIRPKKEMEGQYLLQVLQLDDTLAHLKRIGSGSAVPQLTAKQISELSIPVPDLAGC
ncbi:restriction endonuclease subunit S [Bradyrhizobium sp. CB1650]|uniref:restriction endonuclease subunit S n=1 Tax=Bradyrhizobium sp. CB1650 TaxID=3039153 RepID=UPI002436112A|nr:restriction endonuclease subunit S [Bradyrhizobium sp. CB1650]WGD52979.1 restriction endonuclease subunit S [Bradyrhizobium sp. CB1650]